MTRVVTSVAWGVLLGVVVLDILGLLDIRYLLVVSVGWGVYGALSWWQRRGRRRFLQQVQQRYAAQQAQRGLLLPPPHALFCPYCQIDLKENPGALLHIVDIDEPFLEIRAACDCGARSYWSYWADMQYAAVKTCFRGGKVVSFGGGPPT